MLSAPIQSSTNAPLINSTANQPAPAIATNSAATTGLNNSSENNARTGQEAELFAGQLGDVLVSAELVGSEMTGSEIMGAESVATEIPNEQVASLNPDQSGVEQPGQPQNQEQPNAEAWLQAMLDQQQLQLEARDSAASVTAETPVTAVAPVVVAPVAVVASTGVPSPINATTLTPIQKTVSAITLEKFSNATRDASNASILGMTLNREAIQADRAASPTATDNVFAPVAKVISNSSATAVVANAVPATEANNAANGSSAIHSSATSIAQLTATAMSEASASDSVSSTLAPATLTASGTDNAQRVQTQLNLHTPEAKWGEQLLHALRDNVQVQIQQKIQNATIRLDPPELGSLEIYISHESGRLHVQITASQADVARLIQHTSDRLRQELSGPQFTQVNIQTSAEGQSGQQQSRERQRFVGDERILANEQEFVSSDQQTKRPADVLVTV